MLNKAKRRGNNEIEQIFHTANSFKFKSNINTTAAPCHGRPTTNVSEGIQLQEESMRTRLINSVAILISFLVANRPPTRPEVLPAFANPAERSASSQL